MTEEQQAAIDLLSTQSTVDVPVSVISSWPIDTVDEYNQVITWRRSNAYILESDPLFYEYQREEIEKQVWLDKIQEIKDRFLFI